MAPLRRVVGDVPTPHGPTVLGIASEVADGGSVAGGVALLFVFGAYMGSISGGVWYRAGARMGAAGVVVALLNVVLPG